MKREKGISPKHLLILCCHCVYHQGDIHSEFPGDRVIYEQQLLESIKALQDGYYDVLIISGGYTKKELEKSEAQGMLDWAQDLGLNLNTGKVLLEEYSRDSFENVLFSMARFFQEYRQFPEAICVCSWKSKERRFTIIADALKLPNYSFLGIGEKRELEEAEAKLLNMIINDPFHRDSSLAFKRRERDPWGKGNPYADLDEFREMFKMLNLNGREGNNRLSASGFSLKQEVRGNFGNESDSRRMQWRLGSETIFSYVSKGGSEGGN